MIDTVYEQHARHLIASFGLLGARRMTIQSRNQNSPGTFSYGFHNAVLKEIERFQREAA